VVVGDRPQHPPERVLVGTDGCGQLGQRLRPGGQALGDLQPGDGAQAVPQQPQVDHLDQGLPVGRGVPSHVRSFPSATWQRYTAGGEIDVAGLRFGGLPPDAQRIGAAALPLAMKQ
jgi:hypothetical protein